MNADKTRTHYETLAKQAAAHPRGSIVGRLVARPYQPGDVIPKVGTMTLVSGANADVESDQHRSYGWRQVIGYTDDLQFVCLQTPGCWPTVERMTNCWFAEIPDARTGASA